MTFLDVFLMFFVNIFILELLWIFGLQVINSVVMFKSLCLPGIDHRHTNAKNVFDSLEFSVVAAI